MYVAVLNEESAPECAATQHQSGKFPAGLGEPEQPIALKPSSAEKVEADYQTIGEALLSCEASSARVGIPWFLPLASVRARRYELGMRPEQYIREELVTVSTNVLCMYVDDLSNAGGRQPGDDELHIALSTTLEKFSSVIIFAVAATLIVACAAPSLDVSIFVAIALMLIAADVGALAGLSYSTPQARRQSFLCLLEREVMRRKGIDPNGPTGTPVYTGNVKPVSE